MTGADTAFRLAQVIADDFLGNGFEAWHVPSAMPPLSNRTTTPAGQSWDGTPTRGGLRAGTLRDFINQEAMDQNIFSIKLFRAAVGTPASPAGYRFKLARPSRRRE